MNKKNVTLIIAIFLVIGVSIKLFFFKQPALISPSSQKTENQVAIEPSKTLKNYSDPSGFSLNYPDNLSLLNNELKEENSYAELQITSKDTEGNLLLKIADSKFKTINDWVKSVSAVTPKEVMLGNLKAMEIIVENKILLGALDSGVLFYIEVNLGVPPAGQTNKKDFWMSVYSTVLKDFSFSAPIALAAQGATTVDDISFEGEELVE